MKTQEAVLAFSQSEKIKSGIIWISQVLEFLTGFSIVGNLVYIYVSTRYLREKRSQK